MKRKNKYYLFLLILFISVGFAYLSTNLYTNGTSIIKGTRWSIYFDNIDNENSTYQINNNATISEDKKSVDFEVTFEKPGDEYYFYVDVVNAGNLDAMLDSYEVTGLTADQKKYLEWNVSYSDGGELKKYDLLKKNTKITLLVCLNYKENVKYSELPRESDVGVDLKFKAVYVQADNNFAKEKASAIQYTITYDLNGGIIIDNPTSYTRLDEVTIPNPSREGYKFAGWTGGKNLLDMSDATGGSSNGITCIFNSDGTYSYNGTSICDGTIPINIWFKGDYGITTPLFILPAGTYYFQDISLFYKGSDINGWNGIRTFSDDIEVTGIRAPYAVCNKEYNEIKHPMIVSMYKDTSYEPYISEPIKNIIIPKWSTGNRYYIANWVDNE